MSLPRAIDATKLAECRTPEILAVCEQIKSNDSGRYGLRGLPRGLRRRTRSHNRYKHGRRPNRAKKMRANEDAMEGGFFNRRMRRRENFRKYIDPWEETANPTKVYRLPTHVFHAKRMQMTKLEGSNFIVPLGAFGRGRGTRSFHHKLHTTSVVHDASYWCSIELEGPIREISSLLTEMSRGAITEELDEEEFRVDVYRIGKGANSRQVGPVDILRVRNSEISSVLIWAHCMYSDIVVNDIKVSLDYSHLLRAVGRLGRIEIRGPRSKEILLMQGRDSKVDIDTIREKINVSNVKCIQTGWDHNETATAPKSKDISDEISLSLTCLLFEKIRDFEVSPLDLICMRKDDGYSIIASRRAYHHLFKSICLSGSLIAGQREWHWYYTLSKQLFYPDDYQESLSFKKLISDLGSRGSPLDFSAFDSTEPSKMLPALVWVTKDGTLEVGDVLCHFDTFQRTSKSRKISLDKNLVSGNDIFLEQTLKTSCLGVITSPKPYALQSRYCSVGIVCSKFSEAKKSGRASKTRLWAYSPNRGVIIPVTVIPWNHPIS